MDLLKKLDYVPTLFIDDGHGEGTPGKRTPDGVQENRFNKPTAEKLGNKALAMGWNVVYTAPELKDVPLSVRTDRANAEYAKLKQKYPGVDPKKLAIFVSIHYNAYDGKYDTNKGGVETYHYPGSTGGKALASAIQKYLAMGTPQINRGVKSANFHVLRETHMIAALVEAGFMDDRTEAALMLNEDFQDEVATEILKGCCEYIGIPYEENYQAGTPIIGPATATIGQAQEWAKKNGATQEFIDLAPLYWNLVPSRGGINPAIAYVQAAKETGYGRFGGVIDASYKNPCGLKTTQGGGNYDPAAHKRFSSWEEGITAHLDHLALYAGAPGYPRNDTPDPRHFPFIKDKAATVEALGGKWAPSKTYGESIVRMLKDLETTKEPTGELQRLKDRIAQLEKELEKVHSEKVIAERKAEEERKKYAKYERVFKDIKNLLRGI